MNGYELANWASSEYPELKILLATAMTESVKKIITSMNFWWGRKKPSIGFADNVKSTGYTSGIIHRAAS